MKQLILSFAFFIGIIVSTQGQTTEIHKAISTGNAQELASYFADPIDLTILSRSGVFSKTQATGMINQFFQRHQAQEFIPRHTPKKGESRKFGVGRLVTNKGVFRVSYLIQENDKTRKIRQVRILPAKQKP